MADRNPTHDPAARPRKRRLRGLSTAVLGVSLVIGGQIAGAVPVAAGSGCDAGRQAGPDGHEYQLVCGSVSFSAAKTAAARAGGHLVTINSAKEDDFVAGVIDVPGAWTAWNIDTVTGPWLGLVQEPGSAEPAGGWGWVTGEALTFTKWSIGEPNDGVGSSVHEHRAVFWGPGLTRATLWNDMEAGKTAAYVIEFEPKLALDWTMPARLAVNSPQEQNWAVDGLPGTRQLDPAEWKAKVFLREGDRRSRAPPEPGSIGASSRWTAARCSTSQTRGAPWRCACPVLGSTR